MPHDRVWFWGTQSFNRVLLFALFGIVFPVWSLDRVKLCPLKLPCVNSKLKKKFILSWMLINVLSIFNSCEPLLCLVIRGEFSLSFLGVYRRSRFNEELGQSPAAESPAVNAPSDMRVDMSPSPEGPGKFDLRLFIFAGSSSYHYYFFCSYFFRTVSVYASSVGVVSLVAAFLQAQGSPCGNLWFSWKVHSVYFSRWSEKMISFRDGPLEEWGGTFSACRAVFC